MSIVSEICRAVDSIEKSAQAPGYFSKLYTDKAYGGDGTAQDYVDFYNTHLLRGAARGAKEIVPGTVRGITGLPAGIINGVGHMLAGGSFAKGFKESWNFADKYYADPIRRLEMSLGGNAARNVLDGASKFYADRAGVGDAAKNRAKDIENAAALATELTGGIALAGGAMGSVGKAPIVGRLVPGSSMAKSMMAVVPTAANTSAFAAVDWDNAKKKDHEGAVADFERIISEMSGMDPGSEEYSRLYRSFEKEKRLSPKKFAALPVPTYRPRTTNSNSAAREVLPDGSGVQGNKWYSHPSVQNALGLGGIGALLGLIFGGKGGWWKWALLGSILGGIHGGLSSGKRPL